MILIVISQKSHGKRNWLRVSMVLKCTVKCRQYQQRLQPRAFGRAFKFHGPIFYNTLYILGDSIKQTKEHLAQTVAEFLQDISQ